MAASPCRARCNPTWPGSSCSPPRADERYRGLRAALLTSPAPASYATSHHLLTAATHEAAENRPGYTHGLGGLANKNAYRAPTMKQSARRSRHEPFPDRDIDHD